MIRVGIPRRVLNIPRHSGHGKVWGHTLDELSLLVELVPCNDVTDAAPVDAWLNDGHGGWLPAVKQPIITVVHEAGWNTSFLRSLYRSEFLAAIDRGTGESCRQAAAVIVPSESSCGQISEHYGIAAEKIHVVPDGVDGRVFHPDVGGGSEVIARAGGNASDPYVLCVAQLTARKNLPAVRGAMDEVALRGFPHQLVMVLGASADRLDDEETRRDALRPLDKSKRRVVSVHQPEETELAALMASAAALCQPSFMEGFGLPVLEAMACGTPVVVSDRGALPEIVGSAGIVAPPTAEALAAALVELFEHPEAAVTLGAAASERAKEFTWAKTGVGWLRAIESVL